MMNSIDVFGPEVNSERSYRGTLKYARLGRYGPVRCEINNNELSNRAAPMLGIAIMQLL
jgi:hypothetical protein